MTEEKRSVARYAYLATAAISLLTVLLYFWGTRVSCVATWGQSPTGPTTGAPFGPECRQAAAWALTLSSRNFRLMSVCTDSPNVVQFDGEINAREVSHIKFPQKRGPGNCIDDFNGQPHQLPISCQSHCDPAAAEPDGGTACRDARYLCIATGYAEGLTVLGVMLVSLLFVSTWLIISDVKRGR